MALSAGRNDICSSVIWNHFEPGMDELVSFAQSLIELRTDVSMHRKMREHIVRASQEMHKALEETEGGLRSIEAQSVQLVAQKQHLEKERQGQTQQLHDLRRQLDSNQSLERKSREMLETAQRHLQEMQQQLAQKEAEVAFHERMKNTAMLLMLTPPFGPIAGAPFYIFAKMALDQAEKKKQEAEDEVNRHSADVDQYSAETRRFHALEREAEANIQTSKRRLSSIEREQQQLSSQQAGVVIFQNTLRKCVTFLAVLAGRVDTAEFLSRDIVIYEELVRILEEILNHVFPLMGQGNEMGVRALSTSEIRALIWALESAKECLSLQGPSQGWGNVAIDF